MEQPVLLIGFNRPDRLRAALESIRVAKPRALFIAIDGPRHASDEPRVAECRDIARAIDWIPTETLFHRENLGCQNAVIAAVSWFFSAVDAGIIIEDDAIPDPTFYAYCDHMLSMYEDEPRVLAVAGESRVPPEAVDASSSYRFTYMGAAGAWATWGDRWRSFTGRRRDQHLVSLFRELGDSEHSSISLRLHWLALMVANRTSAMDSWAYPFMIEGLLSRRLTITPNVNLVADKGVGDAASHMQERDRFAQPAGALAFPLVHPEQVAVDPTAERWSTHHEVTPGILGLVPSGARFARRLARLR